MEKKLPEHYNLDGRTALVTGAGGLLGIEHCAALAELGARVVLTDIDAKALDIAIARLRSEFPSSKFHAERLDVSSESEVVALYEALEADRGIDILVNNAAIDPKVNANNTVEEMSRLEHFPLTQWDAQIAVGLTGAFLCAKYFGQGMAQRGSGVILNIASDLAVIAPDQRLYRKEGVDELMQPVKPVTYPVIKTALVGLTRYLSTYWHDRGIRVNALSPGGVFNGQGDEFVRRLCDLIPMGRMARREEYRGAIQFLCSDASSYMTGQNIIIDGGRSVL